MRFIKVVTAPDMGEYKPTALDERKAKADILVTAANGGTYTIKVQNVTCLLNTDLFAGRAIKSVYDNGCIEVTSGRLSQLRQVFKVETDF